MQHAFDTEKPATRKTDLHPLASGQESIFGLDLLREWAVEAQKCRMAVIAFNEKTPSDAPNRAAKMATLEGMVKERETRLLQVLRDMTQVVPRYLAGHEDGHEFSGMLQVTLDKGEPKIAGAKTQDDRLVADIIMATFNRGKETAFRDLLQSRSIRMG